MARLIENIEDLKKHIVVSATFDFKKVLPYAERSERKLILKLIGLDQYDTIVLHQYVEGDFSPINLVRKLFGEAIAHWSLLLALPTINILISNSGTKTVEVDKTAPADWRDKRDLSRSLFKTFNEALDDAFQIMEENVDDFPEWQVSKYYTIFKELIVQQTSQFNDYYNIRENRQTFIALKSPMREVEDQYLLGLLGECTLNFLKSKSNDPIVNKAQEYARKAVVALTVAKVAVTGTFEFTDSSFTVSSDQLPWEKQQVLEKADREDLKKDRQTAGEENLKLLKKIIVANPSVFTCYEDKEETGIKDKIIRKNSGLVL